MFIEKNSTVDIFDHSDGSGNRYRGKVMDLTPDGMTVRNNNTGKTEVIPSADISKRAKSIPKSKAHLDMPSPIKDDFAGAKVPTVKVGDTFDADGKTYTVRQVMPDGAVWANDGKIAHDSNPDKAGSLLENYWNGADRKFAPGEIPDKKVAADKTGGPIDAPVEGMSDEALQNQMDYIDSISDKPPSWFSRKGELSREKDRRDVAAGTAANANSEMTMAKWDTMPLAERSSYNKMSDAEKKAYNQNAAKTSPVAEFDGPGFQQSAKGKVPPEFTSDRKLAQLELALNEAKPAGGTYTTWNIAGRNSLGMTFNGTEEQAKKRFANYDVYNVKHRLNRQDYTVSGWEDVATAGEPVDIPDSAPGVITSWRVSGPNSLGRAFLGTKEDAVKRLSEYERYTQYGNVHVLKKQELIPLPPVEVASTL